jgi:hypothetical protein
MRAATASHGPRVDNGNTPPLFDRIHCSPFTGWTTADNH